MNRKGLPRTILRRAVYSLRSVASVHPRIYLPIAGCAHRRSQDRVVRPDTEFVIEGTPRSGNTFAVAAFELAQRRRVKTAHHLHAAAQVIVAVNRGIPTLVLIRNPVDSALSHMIREPWISAGQALSTWVRFYGSTMPLKNGVVVATFEQVTSDFGEVIREVNRKFGAAFEEFEHTEVNVTRALEIVEQGNRDNFGVLDEITVARPSAERERLKAELRCTLEEDRVAKLCARANFIYRALVPSPSIS